MSNGTVFKSIYRPRLHRSNVVPTYEDAEETIEASKRKLMVWVSRACPRLDAIEIDTEVSDYFEDLCNAVLDYYFAGQMIEFPEECVDDFDGTDAGKELL